MRSITLFVGALVGTASAQTEGDLKLVNGQTAGGYDGLLQVYYKGGWDSVCSGYGSGSGYFEDDHATLVCKRRGKWLPGCSCKAIWRRSSMSFLD